MKELTGETFIKLILEVLKSLFNLVNSSNNDEVITGIIAITKLIELDCSSETRLIAQLRIPLSNTNPEILAMASEALGKLVNMKESEIGDSVEKEINSALEKLNQTERIEHERLSAVLVLKEMAINAPSHFHNSEVLSQFFSSIWNSIVDSKINIRLSSLDALRGVLVLLGKRDSSSNSWSGSLYNKAMSTLKNGSNDSIHGSLLAISELIQNTPKSISKHFKDICEAVSNFKTHKDKLVRSVVIKFQPVLAQFNMDEWMKNYSRSTIGWLLTLNGKDDASSSFWALGKISLIIKEKIKPYMNDIISNIENDLQKYKTAECYQCIEMLSMGAKDNFGSFLSPHVSRFLCKNFFSIFIFIFISNFIFYFLYFFLYLYLYLF